MKNNFLFRARKDVFLPGDGDGDFKILQGFLFVILYDDFHHDTFNFYPRFLAMTLAGLKKFYVRKHWLKDETLFEKIVIQ